MRFFQLTIKLFLPFCITLELNCPCPSERDLRALALCNKSSTLTYSCLYDENRGLNVETCKSNAEFAPPGYKYVLRGLPDFTTCSTDRYQPNTLWSNASNQCIFKKSRCIENGQCLYQNRTSDFDSSCRCDYSRGYAFVAKPRNICFCIPSEEDCSCFKKFCPQTGVLTPEYNCATEKDIQGKNSYNCPIIVHERMSTEKENNSSLKELLQLPEYSSRFIVCVVTSICTFIFTVVGILVFTVCKRQDIANAQYHDRSIKLINTSVDAEGSFTTTSQGLDGGLSLSSLCGDELWQLTLIDKMAIIHLMYLGYSADVCTTYYDACDKNENKAANLLLDEIPLKKMTL